MSRHSVHHVRIANHAERIRAEVIVQYAGEEHVEEAIEQLEAAFVASLSELLERRDRYREAQASADIAAGRTRVAESPEQFFADLLS